jgi:hypothetical protein
MTRLCVSTCALICLHSTIPATLVAQTSSPAAIVEQLNGLLKSSCAVKPTLSLSREGVVVSRDGDGVTSTFRLSDIIGVGGMSDPDGATIILSCRAKGSCIERVQGGAKTTAPSLSFLISPESHGRTAAKLLSDLLASAGGALKK